MHYLTVGSFETPHPRKDAFAHRATIALLALLLAVAPTGCGDDDGTADTDAAGADTVDGNDDTVSCREALLPGANLAGATRKDVLAAGVYANTITIADGFAYVVNSGDNAIQRYAVADPAATSEPAFIDVGTDKNPFDLAVHGGRIYITNAMEGSISVADMEGNLLGTTVLPELVSPQDVVATEDYLLVANTEFTFPVPEGRFGSLVVLTRSDAPSLVARLETTQSNPQFVHVAGDRVYVVNSGATDYDYDTGVVTPSSDGGVDVFGLAGLATASGPDDNVVLPPVGLVGNPGHPAIAGTTMYLGSGTAPVLFALDLATMTAVRGAANPITVAESDGNGLAIPFEGPGGLLYVLDFNGDALRLYDPACDQVVGDAVALGSHAELLEGAYDLAWTDGEVAHIVMSVSSSIATFDAGAVLQDP